MCIVKIKRQVFSFLFLVLSLIFIPSKIYADFIWPSLTIIDYLYSKEVIIIGFLIELLGLHFLLKKPFFKTLKITFVINLFSAVIGFFSFAYLSLIYDFTLSGVIMWIIYFFTRISTTKWLIMLSAIFLSASISSLLEYLALKLFFRISLSKKQLSLFIILNFLSTGLVIPFSCFTRN